MAMALAMIQNVPQYISSFREQRLSAIRPFSEFFDYQRISRPNDLNGATSRITYNTRHFSGNYALIVAALAWVDLDVSNVLGRIQICLLKVKWSHKISLHHSICDRYSDALDRCSNCNCNGLLVLRLSRFWAMLHFLNLVLNQNIHLYNKYEERDLSK
ncbi:hypothetical protein PSHT_15240 [Puccinia striiformis]|uniref:PRA1 family protein n=1 Tax=Puccinia striiformis TaxID=27350 RepID=A0A2S4UFY4_9BASI|nr:hypothetical protein PSHT_15240 [Puccinia striiformis]